MLFPLCTSPHFLGLLETYYVLTSLFQNSHTKKHQSLLSSIFPTLSSVPGSLSLSLALSLSLCLSLLHTDSLNLFGDREVGRAGVWEMIRQNISITG